jgi:hypothetical protein
MTNINMGVNNMLIAGEVYDFEEAKEIEGIAKVVVLIQRIRKIARNK